MKSELILLAWIIACSYTTNAQVESGTVVVFHVTKHKFIIAADSRGISEGKPDDDNCKISAFHHQFVFAAGGASGYKPSDNFPDNAPGFDIVREARDAIYLRGTTGDLNDVADTWANALTEDFSFLYFWHRDKVIEAAIAGKGILVTGIFAQAVKGKIVIAGRSITFRPDREQPVAANPILPLTCLWICAVGLPDVVWWLTLNRSVRSAARFLTQRI